MTTHIQMQRAMRSLDGLSVGDAFGECFFAIGTDDYLLEKYLTTRTLPNHGWRWTDDTAMAIGILQVLSRRGGIDQDDLADTFARNYSADHRRGYGGTAHGILMSIGGGEHWTSAASRVFSGQGSMGNGGAMRAAPLGAFFADDLEECARQAALSAEVTHANRDGIAGAVAIAVAAAFVARNPQISCEEVREPLFDVVLRLTPDSQTRAVIAQARDLPASYAVESAASVLGNGSGVIAPDTVGFCLWSATRCIDNYVEAMWSTVSAGGDMDTNCAIVGGIISMHEQGMPPGEWLARREKLPILVP